jgi:hypothetical protein
VAIIRTKTVVVAGALTATESGTVSDELTYGASTTGAAVTTSFVATQATADALASYLANTSTTDAPLVRIRLDNDSDARLAIMRDLELGQRVIATEAITGATVDGFVEQLTHRITEGGLRHECEIVLTARTRMVGVYSPGTDPVGATVYALSAYTADNPAEPPPYATYGF